MKKRILWVDDNPQNNSDEIGVLKTQGYEFALATSTDEAMDMLGHQSFEAVISDMKRKEGAREGYTLLDGMRANGNQTPFLVYAGSDLEAHKLEVRSHGGQGTTKNAVELLELLNNITA